MCLYRFKSVIRLWRRPSSRVPDRTAGAGAGAGDENSSQVSAPIVTHKAKGRKKKDYTKGNCHVVSGRVSEVVHEKNGAPYFGGPRYNIEWEDGFFEEAVPAKDLIKLYCDTPQSLGARTVLDEDITTSLLNIGRGAGIIVENQKRKEAMRVMHAALFVPNLTDSAICERALDLMLGLILHACEGGIIGIAESDTAKHENFTKRVASQRLHASDVSTLVMRRQSENSTEKVTRLSHLGLAQLTLKARNPGIATYTDDAAPMEWISMEIPVPDSYVWHSNENAHLLVAYILRRKHTNRATKMMEMENFAEVVANVSEAIAICWAKDVRKKARKESAVKLDNLIGDWAYCSSAEISYNCISQILTDHLPGVHCYLGLLQPGGKLIEYIAASAHSRMIGRKLKSTEGISFDVIDKGKTMIIRPDDINKKKNMSVGSTVRVAYGKVFYDATITSDRGHELYDVHYHVDRKQEAAVPMSRIVPTQTAFRIKGYGDYEPPVVVIPVRHRDKVVGVLGLDSFRRVPCASYDQQPEHGLVTFMEHSLKILGCAIDLNAKKRSLKDIASVGKNANAQEIDVFTTAFEAILQNMPFVTALLAVRVMYEGNLEESELGIHEIFMRNQVSKESLQHLGKYDPVKSSFKPIQKRGPNVWLLFRIKPAKKDEEGKIFIVVLELSRPIPDVDVEYLESLQKLCLATLHNVDSRKARDHVRFESLREIKEICLQWHIRERNSLFHEVVEYIQMCYYTANIYVGFLSPYAEVIEYVLANKNSLMFGQKLQRNLNQGISFDAIDSSQPVFVGQTDALAKRLHHFGPREQFEFPFIAIPLIAHLNAVVGIISTDCCQDISTDGEQATGSITSYFYTVASYLGKAVLGYKALDAKVALMKIAFESRTFAEGMVEVKKLLLGYVPYATRVAEINYVPKVVVAAPDESPLLALEKAAKFQSLLHSTMRESFVLIMKVHKAETYAAAITKPTVSFWWQGSEIYTCKCRQVSSAGETGEEEAKDHAVAFKVLIPKGVMTEHVKITMTIHGVVDGVPRDLGSNTLDYRYMVNSPLNVITHTFVSDLVVGGYLGKVSLLSKLYQQDQIVAFQFTGMMCKGLASADTVGSSDPFVIVRWDDSEVGKTSVRLNNLNPMWRDVNISMKLGDTADILDHNLLLEVWDMDRLGRGDFLGCLVARNHDTVLKEIMLPAFERLDGTSAMWRHANSSSMDSFDNDGGVSVGSLGSIGSLDMDDVGGTPIVPSVSVGKKSKPRRGASMKAKPLDAKDVGKLEAIESDFYQLEKHPFLPADTQQYVQGRIKLFSNVVLAKDMSDRLCAQLLDISGASETEDVGEAIDEFDYIECELGILLAKNLFLEAAVGLPDIKPEEMNPFVAVYFNGEEIGKTAVISGTSNPTWEDELMTVRIKGGGGVETCELHIEVMDMGETNKGHHLGSCYIRGKQLAALLAGIKVKKQWVDVEYSGDKPLRDQRQGGQLLVQGRPMSLSLEGLNAEQLEMITEEALPLRMLECTISFLALPPGMVSEVFALDVTPPTEEPKKGDLVPSPDEITLSITFRLNDRILHITQQKTESEVLASRFKTASSTSSSSPSKEVPRVRYNPWAEEKVVFTTPYVKSLFQCKFTVEVMKRVVQSKIVKTMFGAATEEKTTTDTVLSKFDLTGFDLSGYDIVNIFGNDGCSRHSYVLLADPNNTNWGDLALRGGVLDAPDLLTHDGRTVHLDVLAGAALSKNMNPTFRSSQRAKAAETGVKSTWNDERVNTFCKVFWNGRNVGESNTIENCSFPLWVNQRFSLYPPQIEGEDESLHHCNLKIEVWTSAGAPESRNPNAAASTSPRPPGPQSKTDAASAKHIDKLVVPVAGKGDAAVVPEAILLGTVNLSKKEVMSLLGASTAHTEWFRVVPNPEGITDDDAFYFDDADCNAELCLRGGLAGIADEFPDEIGNEEVFKLQVLGASGLARIDVFGASDPFVTVEWGAEDAELGRTCILHGTVDPVFKDESFLMRKPRHDPDKQVIDRSFLRLNAFSYRTAMVPDFLGCVTLKGAPLRKFSLMGNSKMTKAQMEFSRKANMNAVDPLALVAPLEERDDMNPEENAMVQGTMLIKSQKLEFMPFHNVVKRLREQALYIISCADLSMANSVTKSSDAYCNIIWTLKGASSGAIAQTIEVGHTKTVPDSLNPDFDNAKFIIQVPIYDNEWVTVAVRIEVRDQESGYFLGCYTLTGSELQRFFNIDNYEKNNEDKNAIPHVEVTVSRPLTHSILLTAAQQSLVGGSITVSNCPVAKIAPEVEAEEVSVGEEEEAVVVVVEEAKVKKPTLTEDDPEIQEAKWRLNIHSAKGVSKANTFGLSDPYVVVYWCDRKVGQTVYISDTCDPVYDSEVFILLKPFGSKLGDCSLYLEIYDFNNMVSDKFLGSILLEGNKLEDWLGKKRDNSDGACLQPKDFDLGPSLKFDERSTVTVYNNKGSLNISGRWLRPILPNQHEANSTQIPSSLKHIEITLLAANGLAPKNRLSFALDTYAKVYWGYDEIGTTAVVKDTLFPVWETDETFNFWGALGLGNDPGSPEAQALILDEENTLVIELYSVTRVGPHEFLGSIEVRGEQLLTFVHRGHMGTTWFDLASSSRLKKAEQPSKIKGKVELLCAPKVSGEDAFGGKEMELVICQARGLSQASAFVKTDSYVKIRWNHKIIGKTAVVKGSTSPEWEGEKHIVHVPGGMELENCALVLEVWDWSITSRGTFLGCACIEGAELVELVEGSNFACKWFTLGSSDYFPSKSSRLAGGQLELQCGYVGSHEHLNTNMLKYEISVLEAHGLSKVDLFGLCDPYVLVKWNSREVGRTVHVEKSLDPQWVDQRITLAVGVNEPLDDPSKCCLVLEAWDYNVVGKGSFLGCVRFVGAELVDLLSPDTDMEEEYDLVRDPQMDPKKQKHVKGTLHIGVRYILSAAEMSEAKNGGAVEMRWFGIRDPDAGHPMCELRILGAHHLLHTKVLLGQTKPFCTVRFHDQDLGHTATIKPTEENHFGSRPVWENEVFYLHVPEGIDTETARVVVDVWDAPVIYNGQASFLGRISLTFHGLLRLFDGHVTLPLTPDADHPYVNGTLTLGVSFVHPYWDRPQVHIPTKHARRLRIVSADELPHINDNTPSTKCLIQVNGTTRAKSMLVSRTTNPVYGAMYCDMNVDVAHEVDVNIIMMHVDARDRREVCIGEVRVPFEFLLRPPAEAWDCWLGPASRPAPAKYLFTTSGSVKVMVSINHGDEEAMLPYAYYNEGFPGCGVLVNDPLAMSTKHVRKSKEQNRAEGKALSPEQRLWLGTSIDFRHPHALQAKPDWLVLPMPDLGFQFGTKEKDRFGGRPGHRYALCLERPTSKAFSSDADLVGDIYDSLKHCVNELRKKEVYRELRAYCLRGFRKAVDKFVATPDFDANIIANWLCRAIFQCFPDSHVSVGKVVHDTLQYTIYDGVENVALTAKEIESIEHSSTRAPRHMALRRGIGCDWECIGRDATKVAYTKTIRELEERVVVLDRAFRYVSFPRIVVPFSVMDVSLGFVSIENLGVYRGGKDKGFTDEPEVLHWLEQMCDCAGDVMYRGREYQALRDINAYVEHWSSNKEGLIHEIIRNCMRVLVGCRMLEVWALDPDYKLRSVSVKTPYVPPVQGIELVVSKITVLPTQAGLEKHSHQMAFLGHEGGREQPDDLDSFSIGSYSTQNTLQLLLNEHRPTEVGVFVMVLTYNGIDQVTVLHETHDNMSTLIAAHELKVVITNERNINLSIFYLDCDLKIIEEYGGRLQLVTFKEEGMKAVLTEHRQSAAMYNAEVVFSWPEKYDHLEAAGVSLNTIQAFDVTIKSAVGLHRIETLTGTIDPDPCCEVFWGADNRIGKTSVKKATTDPDWGENYTIPFQASRHSSHALIVEVYHMDLMGKGPLLGCVEIPVDQLANPPPNQTWIDYPLNIKQGLNVKKQNYVGGTLTLSYKAEKVELAPLVDPTETAEVDERSSNIPPNVILMETPCVEITVCSCSNLFKANLMGSASDPFVMVFLGKGKEMLSKTKVIKSNVNPIWDETFTVNLGVQIEEGVTKFADFPSVRLEVWDSTAFGPGTFLGCCELTPAWYFSRKAALFDLGPSNLHDDKLNKNAKQGSMSMKFKIFDHTLKGDQAKHIVSELHGTLMPAFLVEVHIVRARGLGSFHRVGKKSDPYAMVKWNGEVVGKTGCKKGTLDPSWNNEMFLINISEMAGFKWGDVVIEMYHQDFFTVGDFMGEVRIPIETLLHPRPGNVDVELRPRNGEKSSKIKGTLTYKLVQRWTPQRLNIKPTEYLEDAYNISPLSPVPMTIVKDPREEVKRQKYENMAYPEILAKVEAANQEYVQNPFERNGLVSELHYGQMVAACERYETRYQEKQPGKKGANYAEKFADAYAIMRTEKLEMLMVPTIHMNLGKAAGVTAPDFSAAKDAHARPKKKEKLTAKKEADAASADILELLSITARYDANQLPKRDLIFLRKIRDVLLVNIKKLMGRFGRAEQLQQLAIHTNILTRADDLPANALVEAVFDIEQAFKFDLEPDGQRPGTQSNNSSRPSTGIGMRGSSPASRPVSKSGGSRSNTVSPGNTAIGSAGSLVAGSDTMRMNDVSDSGATPHPSRPGSSRSQEASVPTMPVMCDMFTLHLDGKTLVQIKKDTGRPIEVEDRSEASASMSMSRPPLLRGGPTYRTNPIVNAAARICRHGYIVQYYKGLASVVGMEWTNSSQMSAVPLSACAATIDDLEGHGFTKHLEASLAAKELTGCFLVPMFINDEIMVGMMYIYNIDKNLQHALYRTLPLKVKPSGGLATVPMGKEGGKRKVDDEASLEVKAPEDGVVGALISTGHNVGLALFHNHLHTAKHGLRNMDFWPTTTAMDVFKFAIRTLFAGIPAFTEISIWAVDVDYDPMVAATNALAERQRRKMRKKQKKSAAIVGFLSSKNRGDDADDDDQMDEGELNELPPIVTGCFGVESADLLLAPEVQDAFTLPAALIAETKTHSRKYSRAVSFREGAPPAGAATKTRGLALTLTPPAGAATKTRGLLFDNDDGSPKQKPAAWKVKIPYCMLPVSLAETKDTANIPAFNTRKRARSDAQEEVATSSFLSSKRADEDQDPENPAMDLVHAEIVRCVKGTKAKSFHVATGHLLCQLGDEESPRKALDEMFSPGYKETTATDPSDMAAEAAAKVAADLAADLASSPSRSKSRSFSNALFGALSGKPPKPTTTDGGLSTLSVATDAIEEGENEDASQKGRAFGKDKPPLPGGARPPPPAGAPSGKPSKAPGDKPRLQPLPPKVERQSSFFQRGLSAVGVTTKLFNSETVEATVHRKYFLSVQTHGKLVTCVRMCVCLWFAHVHIFAHILVYQLCRYWR